MRYAYLENTTAGHNKFYEMIEDSGGKTFTVKYGRIGNSPQKMQYNIGDWYKKHDEKMKKGYIDLTHTKNPPSPPKPKFETNQEHLKKVNQVYTILNLHKDEIVGGDEYIRDVGAIRASLKDPKSIIKGKLSKEDMIWLNDIWKKIKHYAKKD